ncbi:MAG: site-specific integrase [bacterium]|nr:site-specific integrase [bacterium]
MAVNQITGADVMACLAPIWNRKEETARRVLQRVSAVMRWAVAQGFRVDNPADRRIKAALGSNSAKAQHFKALHHSEVAQAIATIRATNAWKCTILCFEFLTLCAVRSGEARLATWDEIDLATATWTIPGTRTKTSKPHRVPLSRPALAVLDEVREHSGGVGLIFPTPRGKPMSNATMSKLCKENNIGCVPHGMRSSFRDWCGETGVSRELAEAALAHTVKGVEGAYARSDLLERRRELMERWGRYIET